VAEHGTPDTLARLAYGGHIEGIQTRGDASAAPLVLMRVQCERCYSYTCRAVRFFSMKSQS